MPLCKNCGMQILDNVFFCPECGAIGRHRKPYRTRAGTTKHYMSCVDRECDTSFVLSNKAYQDFLQFKRINNLK